MAIQLRPTLTQVAEAAGVSPATASRALRHDRRVAASTRERIEAVASELGFTQNALASSLRKQSGSSLVGLIVPRLTDPFFAAVASSMQSAAGELGLDVIIACHHDSSPELGRLVKQMVAHRAQALVFVPTPGAIPAALIRESKFDTALVSLDCPANTLGCDAVLADNAGGAAQLTTALLQRGHTSLAVASLDGNIWTQKQRLRAVRDTLAEAGLTLDDEAVVAATLDTELSPERAFEMLQTVQPTAVIGLSVRPLVAVIRAARQIGAQLDFACFDGDPIFDLLPETIIGVEQDPMAIGRAALDRVMASQIETQGSAASAVLPVRGPFTWGAAS